MAVGVVAAAALAGSLVYALHATSAGPTAAVAASLGAPTEAVPASPTGQFSPAGSVIRQGGKPELLFVGAQYCPFCAAERWAVVKALSQFGTFSGLASSSSSSGEGGFGAIPTFNLLHATYRSSFVAFVHKDIEDRNHNSLQTLTSQEQALFSRNDPDGGIPMVLAGGYKMEGAGYSPGEIDNKPFSAVQRALRAGHDTGFARDINAETNVITALLCHADGGRPAATCDRSGVSGIASRLR